MFEHLDVHQTALPPPMTTGAAHDRHRLHVQRGPFATTVLGTVILTTLVIVSALAVIATMPAAIVAPVAILLVGGLIAGSLAIRARTALARRAHPGTARLQSVTRRAAPQ